MQRAVQESCKDVQRCRYSDKVKRFRGLKVQRFKGSEVMFRCSGAEVQSCAVSKCADVQMCRIADVQEV